MSTQAQTKTENRPIFIDFFKKEKEQIEELRRGEGTLASDIEISLKALQERGEIAADAQVVVAVVQEK